MVSADNLGHLTDQASKGNLVTGCMLTLLGSNSCNVQYTVYCTVCTVPRVHCHVYCAMCPVYTVHTVHSLPCASHLQICSGGGITIALLARISSLLNTGERGARRLKEGSGGERGREPILLGCEILS